MDSLLTKQHIKNLSAVSGSEGTMALTAIVTNKIVTSTNMKVGTYTIAAQPVSPALLSFTVTTVSGADTMGTIAVVGTNIYGVAQSETVTHVSGSTVYTSKVYAAVTSLTGAGWVVNTTADTIIVGTAGIVAPTGYYFTALQVVSTAVVASQTNISGYTIGALSTLSSLPVGLYPTRCSAIALTSGTGLAYLAKI